MKDPPFYASGNWPLYKDLFHKCSQSFSNLFSLFQSNVKAARNISYDSCKGVS